MRLQTWAVAEAEIVERTLSIESHSRGTAQPGGAETYAIGGGARWTGSITIAPMLPLNAFRFRGQLNSLRGRSGSVLVPLDSGATVSSTLAASAAVGADSISVVQPGGFTPVVGGWLYVGTSAAGQLLRVAAIVTAGANWTITVRPRLRIAFSSGAAVRLRGVTAPFRLANEPPEIAIVAGGRSLPIEMEIEEAY